MNKYAVITFDEPEFEPSYIGTPNEGKSIFSKLFFCGKCEFSDISFSIYKHRSFIKATAYLLGAIYYSLKSKLMRSETIFDTLEEFGITGTFYGVFNLIDNHVWRNTFLPYFNAIKENNHEIGLHGYSHLPISKEGLKKSQLLASDLLDMKLCTYSSPWGDDRLDAIELLRDNGFFGFRVWNKELIGVVGGMVCLGYENNLTGLDLNSQEIIILNIHAPDYYPFGRGYIRSNIKKLINNGYSFLSFKEICQSVLNGDIEMKI